MPTLLTPPTLEVVMQGLDESEIRCGIQNDPPAGGITDGSTSGARPRRRHSTGPSLVIGRSGLPPIVGGGEATKRPCRLSLTGATLPAEDIQIVLFESPAESVVRPNRIKSRLGQKPFYHIEIISEHARFRLRVTPPHQDDLRIPPIESLQGRPIAAFGHTLARQNRHWIHRVAFG